MVWEIFEGLRKAVELIISGNPTVLEVTLRSIYVSGTATLLAVLWSLPIATFIGLKEFRGKRFVKGVFNALLGLPTVALGLLLYLLLSKSGPLGALGLLFSPIGIILGQAILVTPIIVSLIINAVESVEPEIKDLARTLGASETEVSFTVLHESRKGVILAFVASFNRAIAELGVALMLGGNIVGYTRVLTTAIALETQAGEIEQSIALTIILLSIVFTVSFISHVLQRQRK